MARATAALAQTGALKEDGSIHIALLGATRATTVPSMESPREYYKSQPCALAERKKCKFQQCRFLHPGETSTRACDGEVRVVIGPKRALMWASDDWYVHNATILEEYAALVKLRKSRKGWRRRESLEDELWVSNGSAANSSTQRAPSKPASGVTATTTTTTTTTTHSAQSTEPSRVGVAAAGRRVGEVVEKKKADSGSSSSSTNGSTGNSGTNSTANDNPPEAPAAQSDPVKTGSYKPLSATPTAFRPVDTSSSAVTPRLPPPPPPPSSQPTPSGPPTNTPVACVTPQPMRFSNETQSWTPKATATAAPTVSPPAHSHHHTLIAPYRFVFPEAGFADTQPVPLWRAFPTSSVPMHALGAPSFLALPSTSHVPHVTEFTQQQQQQPTQPGSLHGFRPSLEEELRACRAHNDQLLRSIHQRLDVMQSSVGHKGRSHAESEHHHHHHHQFRHAAALQENKSTSASTQPTHCATERFPPQTLPTKFARAIRQARFPVSTTADRISAGSTVVAYATVIQLGEFRCTAETTRWVGDCYGHRPLEESGLRVKLERMGADTAEGAVTATEADGGAAHDEGDVSWKGACGNTTAAGAAAGACGHSQHVNHGHMSNPKDNATLVPLRVRMSVHAPYETNAERFLYTWISSEEYRIADTCDLITSGNGGARGALIPTLYFCTLESVVLKPSEELDSLLIIELVAADAWGLVPDMVSTTLVDGSTWTYSAAMARAFGLNSDRFAHGGTLREWTEIWTWGVDLLRNKRSGVTIGLGHVRALDLHGLGRENVLYAPAYAQLLQGIRDRESAKAAVGWAFAKKDMVLANRCHMFL